MDWMNNGIEIRDREQIEKWIRRAQRFGINYHDAEDVFQDCILKLLLAEESGRLPNFVDPKRTHAYFSKSVSNAAVDQRRKSGRQYVPRTGLKQLPERVDCKTQSPSDHAELSELIGFLHEALNQLKREDRELVEMLFEEELHKADIAKAIGVKSERTVRNRMNQAKDQVAVLVQRQTLQGQEI